MKAGILGATGYTGRELIRILDNHPYAELVYLGSSSSAGKPIAEVYPGLTDFNTLMLNEEQVPEVDVLFCALPHGLTASKARSLVERGIRVIDLGADFRLENSAVYKEWYKKDHPDPAMIKNAVYGLPEINREEIQGKELVANPGCYPTAVQIALIPFLQQRLIIDNSIIVDAKSGVSGAGKNPSLGVHFSEVNENFKAYGVAEHRHIPEIEQQLSKAAGEDITISFTPHLVPMTRGILATIYADVREGIKEKELKELWQDYYAKEKFIHLLREGDWPQTKYAYGSNHVFLQLKLDQRTGRVIIVSVLDNLVKGASGQAVQNMNILFGFQEETGLQTVSLWP